MRKTLTYLIIAAAAAVLGACTATEQPTPGPALPDGAIGFTQIQTKGVTEPADIEDFNVWGTTVVDGESVTNYSTIFSNTKVSLVTPITDPLTWAYAPEYTQYWLGDKQYSFMSISPFGAATTALTSNKNISVAFTLPDAMDVDLMAAYNERHFSKGDDITPVNMAFSHILANIRFNFEREEGATDAFTLTKVTLAGFLPNGSCSVTGTSTGLTPVTWTVSGDAKTLEKLAAALPNSGVIDNDHTPISLNNGDGIYVLPQNASTIECTINYTVGSGATATEKTATGYLPAQSWVLNNIYTYKVILSGTDAIIFAEPTVEPWGEELNSGSVVII